MAEEKLQAEEPKPVTEENVKEEPKPTLEDIVKQNKELNDKLDRISKQNSDKDSHISRIEGENRTLRETVEKVTTTLEGKSSVQKDAILEREKEKLLKRGYDKEAVDSLLESISLIAEQKAQIKVAPIIMDAAQDLVESDPEIDKDFLEKNKDRVAAEYNQYKTEFTPRKIKQNLKKAYMIVKEQMAKTAKDKEQPEDKKAREDMVKGAGVAPKGTKQETSDNLLDRIDKAGSKSGHFV